MRFERCRGTASKPLRKAFIKTLLVKKISRKNSFKRLVANYHNGTKLIYFYYNKLPELKEGHNLVRDAKNIF